MYEFANMKNASKLIPECQTNFVYAMPKPKTINDVFGVRGRIVRTGKSLTVCGVITAGGSKHVASAVIQMCMKFPTVRAAINIRYDESILKRIKSAKMHTASYDRSIEPSSIKNAKNGSVSWGIRTVIKNVKTPYDAVYHTGDHGKEPMILIFGKTPQRCIIQGCKNNLACALWRLNSSWSIYRHESCNTCRRSWDKTAAIYDVCAKAHASAWRKTAS